MINARSHTDALKAQRDKKLMANLIAEYSVRGQSDKEDAHHFVNMQRLFKQKYPRDNWRDVVKENGNGKTR